MSHTARMGLRLCAAPNPATLRLGMRSFLRTTALVALLPLTALPTLSAEAQTGGATRSSPPPAAAGTSPGASTPARTGPLASALEALRTTDYARAEKELGAIAGADKPEADLLLARAYFEQGKHEQAEKAAQRASSDARMRPGATVLRAEIAWAEGRGPDAMKLLESQKDGAGKVGLRARLLLGTYRIASGRRADAERPLMDIIEDYNDDKIDEGDAEALAIAARAAHLLRSPKDANTLFNKSERAGGEKRVETLLLRAELFLDKYDPGHAEEVTREALAIAPNHADALVTMARVKLEQTLDFDAAQRLAKKALEVNPKHTGAFAVSAGIALRDMDLDEAERRIASGLAINPNDLELLSLRAATRFLADDPAGYERAKKEVLRRNPEYSTMHVIVGEYAEWEHRYDDIVAMMKEAVKIDPDDAKAWAQLGLTMMRSGDEPGGLAAIRKAWDKDRFNVRVYNTLNLYEQTIARSYETGDSGLFRIRYPKAERAILERYVPRLSAEAFASMKARYGFAPTTPVQLELYGSRQDFSIRTSGLPNIGIQGVCFGSVVAAMSPKSEPFNWGNVVWHELGHVFAIQLSRNHVPRWFTEGLSEYETIVRRPEWKRELDPQLYLAIKAGRLPRAVDMNQAFTHADNGEDVTVAYYASSQMVLFTVERFGMGRVVKALALWGKGVRTPEVIPQAFGVSASDYDAQFRAWALARMKRYDGQFVFDERPKALDLAEAAVKAKPNDAAAHADLAWSKIAQARDLEAAEKALATALRLDPAQKSALFISAKLAFKKKQVGAARSHLEALRKSGGDGYAVQMALADLAEATEDKAAMKAALEAAHRFDPSQPDPLKGLFDMAREAKQEDLALDVLRRLAPLEQHDRRVWRMLLEQLVGKQAWAEAARVGESAIFVDVATPATHAFYARALEETGRLADAAFEYESALVLNPPAPEAATAHAGLARVMLARKNVAEARRHRDEALRLDPQNAEAKRLTLP